MCHVFHPSGAVLSAILRDEYLTLSHFSRRHRPLSQVARVCTVVVMSYLVNMSSDVMWYASQSGHAIYRGSRGIGLEKNLRCSLVF